MTTDDANRTDLDAMRDALRARIDETRAIDTKRALEGICANRDIRRNHRHSVRHRAYR